MMAAFVIALVMNAGAYFFSDQIVLAAYRAQPVEEKDAPELYEILRELCQRSTLPMPRLFWIPSASPNAFATGRDPEHAIVVVTEGIVKLLNREELQGVLAHELSHVKHRDILLSSIAAVLAGAVTMLANMLRWSFLMGDNRRDEERRDNALVLLVSSILIPIAAALIQLAISRSREFDADEAGAHISDSPLYLASALRKIDVKASQIPLREADPSTAHLFITNPLPSGGWTQLFSTHPSTEERIMRLEKMAEERKKTDDR